LADEAPDPNPKGDLGGTPKQSRLRSWTPHLLVFVMPVAAVLIGYGLWFLLIAVLRAPDWLARLFTVHS
jgi:hypothetical protein